MRHPFCFLSLGTTTEQLGFEELGKKNCAKRIVDEDGVGFIDYFNS
jgi:hypothetical protein